MYIILKYLPSLYKKGRLYTQICLIIAGLTGITPVLAPNVQEVEASFRAVNLQDVQKEELILESRNKSLDGFSTIQSNSLSAISSPLGPQVKVLNKLAVITTGYSSTPEETDDTPFITASGKTVRDGIIASNLLPFGTKVMLPDLFGNKIFVVEDRMHSRKGIYQVDVWFPSRKEALNFGAKLTEMEIVKEI